MDNIRVSVIIPVYNEEKYISATLDSVLNQDFDSYEIIVVDDGSTDRTSEIVNEKLSDSEIPHKIIRQENKGVSAARNRAIDEASGEYIIFVDGDDYILTGHLREIYNKDYDFSLIQLVKKESDNVTRFRICCRPEKRLLVKKDSDNVTSPHIYDVDEMDTEEFIRQELEMKIPFNFVQLSYRTDIIKNNNLKFREDVTYGEDSDFALKALSLGDKIKISNEITYYYIQNEESLINTSKLKRFDYIPVLEDLADFYRERGLNDMANLIHTSRIPRAIFGNMNYFFYNGYDYDEVIAKMKELDLFTKLSRFEGDSKFLLKIRLFLLNPKLYYKMWKKFKNSID